MSTKSNVVTTEPAQTKTVKTVKTVKTKVKKVAKVMSDKQKVALRKQLASDASKRLTKLNSTVKKVVGKGSKKVSLKMIVKRARNGFNTKVMVLGVNAMQAFRGLGLAGYTTGQALVIGEHFKTSLNSFTIARSVARGHSGALRNGKPVLKLTGAQLSQAKAIVTKHDAQVAKETKTEVEKAA